MYRISVLFELGYGVKQFSQAGVRIFSYLEDREILLDTPTDKFLMSAVSFAAEIEREKARQRMREEILSTTAADIREFAEAMAAVAARGRVVVLGSGQAIAAANAERPGLLSVSRLM